MPGTAFRPPPAVATLWFAASLFIAIGIAAEDLTCINGVTVIDPRSGQTLSDRRVVLSGERIAEVTRQSADLAERPCKTSVDGRGKYLIPGLWDMHVHGTRRESTYPLYLANGVTGVREMFGPPDAKAFRVALAARGIDAPRMLLASPVIDGAPPIMPTMIAVSTDEEGRRAVADQVRRGADFIKVYQRLPRHAYFAIVAESARMGIPVEGHVPASITPWEAAAAGQRSIEHLTRIPVACSADEARLRGRPVTSYIEGLRRGIEASDSFDEAKCGLLFAAFRRNGTWIVPTLTALRSDFRRDDSDFRDDDRLRYFDAETRAWLAPASTPNESNWSDVDREFFAFNQKLVGEMFRAGVRLLAGSDVLNPYVFPGFSLHDELALLVESGLTPLAALQAATSSAAEFMGREADYGSVSVGKVADLVLLGANPLDDIRNTTAIEAVFLGGKAFDRAALDALLAAAEE